MDEITKRVHPNILRAQERDAMPGTPKVHFLNDQARRLNKSLGDATGLSQMGIHWIEIQPGFCSTECHRHFVEEEAVYILEGQGVVTLDECDYAVQAGDFIGLPAGGPAHVFSNPGPQVLRGLVVGQRLEFDEAEYTRLNKKIFRTPQGWSLVEQTDIVDPTKASGSTVGKK